jgi:geranylgeranyl reductase family protein
MDHRRDGADADVIVVGAGPAGAAAACDLARRNRRILLVDRQAFPRAKTCGDGVPPGSIEILNQLGMGDAVEAAGFYPIGGIRIGSPAGVVWEATFRAKRDGLRFLVAPRERFDAIIQRAAVENGADFVRAGVRDLIVDGGVVKGVLAKMDGATVQLRSRVVIGADGATSVVRRRLKPGGKLPPSRRAVAIRGYVDGIDTLPHRVEFYFTRALRPGYGWIFPMGPDSANVGVYTRVDRLKQGGSGLEALLDDFLRTKGVRDRLRPGYTTAMLSSWQLPCGADRPDTNAFDGALLVGDAAALVDPLTGEGIHNALVSARIAAGVVDEALDRRDCSSRVLSAYDRRSERSLGGLIRRSARVQDWVDRAPWWVDILFSVANTAPGLFRYFLNRKSSDFVITG